MIRQAGINDLQEIIKIEENSFKDAWSLKTYKNLFGTYNVKLFIEEKNKKILSYAFFLDMVDIYELVRIAVLPPLRRKGLAEKLLKEGIKDLNKNILLEVREENFSAISLYKKLKFQQINIRKNYYKDTGEDALIMLYEK